MTDKRSPFRSVAKHLVALLKSGIPAEEVEHALRETYVNALARAAFIAEEGGNREFAAKIRKEIEAASEQATGNGE